MASEGDVAAPSLLGPQVNITVWICFVIAGLAVTAKVLTKLGRSQRQVRFGSLQLDDYLLLVSLALAAGQSLAVSRQVADGLGTDIFALDIADAHGYEKAGFAAELLYIGALLTAKMAAFLFALNLQPHSQRKLVIHGLMGFTVTWAIVAILGISFQCKLPQSWAITSDKCFNQPVFWAVIESINGLTDLCLVAILCIIVWKLQVSKAKFMLLSVFAARALVIAPIIFRIYHISEMDKHRHKNVWNPTIEEVDVAIATAVLMNTSIVVTCIPFLRPLMEQLQPGWSTNDVIRGVGYNVMYGKGTVISGQYPMGSVLSSHGRRNTSHRSESRAQSSRSLNPKTSLPHIGDDRGKGVTEMKGAVIKRTDIFQVESMRGSASEASRHSSMV